MPGRMSRDAICMWRPAAALPARHGRDGASRHRLSHRSGQRRAHPARGTVRLTTRPIHLTRTYPRNISWWRLTIRGGAGLPHQSRFDAWRRGAAAGPIDAASSPIRCASPRQYRSDSGHARERRHPHYSGRPGGAEKSSPTRAAYSRDEVSIAPNGGKAYGPRHLDFHPNAPGCTCRSRPRTSWTCRGWMAPDSPGDGSVI